MFEIADFIKARKESKDKITRVISAWSVREETIHEEGFQDGATFGYNKAKEEMQAQIEKMKKYIKACWVEENLNDYSSYITNTSDEFRDLVKELNNEVRNGR